MSSPYGYGQGQPRVLPPPQSTPWPQQQQPPGQPGQWGQPYGGGYPQFNGFGPPPRQRSSGCLKILLFGLGAVILILIGLIVLAGAFLGDSPTADDDPDQPRVTGPSIVPSPTTRTEQGSAEDVLLNSPMYGAGRLEEMDCPAERLGNGNLPAQKRYFQKLFKCLNDGWRPTLDKAGFKQPDPGLVVFDKPVSTPCGNFAPLSGRVLAFYCYGNNVMYTDVQQMTKAFGAKEDLAYLMTIAHEYGHHIQGVSGLFYARMSYLQDHPDEKLDSSRRNELQASCFAGVFSKAVEKSYPLTNRRREFDYQASNSFGDSASTPEEERTHGKATSQGFWIVNGFNIGETKACNTFAAPENLVQ